MSFQRIRQRISRLPAPILAALTVLAAFLVVVPVEQAAATDSLGYAHAISSCLIPDNQWHDPDVDTTCSTDLPQGMSGQGWHVRYNRTIDDGNDVNFAYGTWTHVAGSNLPFSYLCLKFGSTINGQGTLKCQSMAGFDSYSGAIYWVTDYDPPAGTCPNTNLDYIHNYGICTGASSPFLDRVPLAW